MPPATLFLSIQHMGTLLANLDNSISVGIRGGDPAEAPEVEQAQALRAEIVWVVPWVDGKWPPITDSLAVTLDDKEWAFIRRLLAETRAIEIEYSMERSGEDLEETLRVQLDGP